MNIDKDLQFRVNDANLDKLYLLWQVEHATAMRYLFIHKIGDAYELWYKKEKIGVIDDFINPFMHGRRLYDYTIVAQPLQGKLPQEALTYNQEKDDMKMTISLITGAETRQYPIEHRYPLRNRNRAYVIREEKLKYQKRHSRMNSRLCNRERFMSISDGDSDTCDDGRADMRDDERDNERDEECDDERDEEHMMVAMDKRDKDYFDTPSSSEEREELFAAEDMLLKKRSAGSSFSQQDIIELARRNASVDDYTKAALQA
jgi:hypothetical protein